MMICYNSKSRRISMIQEILQSQAAKERQNTDRKVKRRVASAHSLTYTTGKSLTAEKKGHMQTFKTHVSLLF